jgi:hypothetical protein
MNISDERVKMTTRLLLEKRFENKLFNAALIAAIHATSVFINFSTLHAFIYHSNEYNKWNRKSTDRI